MRHKIEKGKPILFFVRVKGKKGNREYNAVLDTGSECCIIPTQDAREMGYEAYGDPDDPGSGVKGVTKTDMIEFDDIELEEVRVADLVAKNVKALAHYLPTTSRVEATIGLSFLKNFKTTIDYETGYLSIENIGNNK
jgi:predicted aspartyl protease